MLYAQEEPKSIYTDSTGKVFVKAETPLKLYMGTTQNGSNATEIFPFNSNRAQLFWNSSGPKTMQHLDLYLGRNINFILHADGLPPKSELTIKQSVSQNSADTIYIKGDAIVEISTTDNGVGTCYTLYQINNGQPTRYTQPITLETEGKYQIAISSEDNLGNKEDEIVRYLIVDNTAPQTSLTITGDQSSNIISGHSQLALTSTDRFGVSQITYQIDSAAQMRYASPIQSARIREGEHTIRWFATDRVGNIENLQSYTFFVDKTPPIVFEEIVGNTYMVGDREFSSGRSQLKIAAVDNKAGIKEIQYSLNGHEYVSYKKPVTLSDIMGTIKVKSYAIDNVNNRSQSGTSGEIFNMPTIDITGPHMQYNLIGTKTTIRDTIWIGPSTKIQIRATDKEAGVSHIIYRINNEAEATYTNPFCIDKAGLSNVKCTAFDNVENINFLNFELCVDCTAPEIFSNFSVKPHCSTMVDGKAIPTYSNHVMLFLAATDNVCGEVYISYTINGSSPISYTKPIREFKPNSLNAVTIYVKDKLGNSRTETLNFWVTK